jgi:aminopeptidase N
MGRHLLTFLVAVVLVAAVATLVYLSRNAGSAPLIGPGIPEVMAEDRAARVHDLTYEASFTVPAIRTEPVRGQITARFTLDHADHDLAFDFAQPAEKLLSARVNGSATSEVVSRDGHLVVPAALLRGKADNEVTFTFIAGDEALNRQDELLYTLFVPARASLALPVFDQPNLKGRWVVSLNVPNDWVAVANGAETGRVESEGRTEIIFAKTEPLPTYLVAFAAGKFSVETAERAGRTFRMFHRETDAAKVKRNADAVFDLHASSVAWLEDYTASPYAFGKFDFVLIPSFQFGGMEHAGAVFYNQSSLLLDESATQNQRLGRASLIAHETAHMWFGDLVTMRWFNDVWMKEVFANFMAAKIVNPSFPEVNHPLRFLYSHYPAAYDVDRTAGANPIRQPLANLSEAGSLYGAIIYQKAPIVMRQLEQLIGEEPFRDGLREYVKTYAMSNATWSDLIAILDRRTPTDLVAWSRAWVEERGRPRIHLEVATPAAGTTDLRLRSEDPLGRALVWPQSLSIVLGGGDRVATVDVSLGDSGEAAVSHTSSTFPDGPRWVLPTGGGLGYGDFVLPTDMLTRLAEDIPSIVDPLTRGAAVVTLWESMLEGRISSEAVRTSLLQSVAVERDELNLVRQLGYLQTTFWRFTKAADRPSVATQIEPVLRAGLARASGTSQKSVWFSAIKNTALSPEVVEWLERVWRKDVVIDDLPFSENDEADLAMELALRGVDVLDAQEARIKNPDRKARFVFVRPSVSPDLAIREALFSTFSNVDNRRREAWVLEAMNYLHHPLKADDVDHLVIPALHLLLEIRNTGDIFFPKRWADATLGGHQSAATAADVRAFINGLPSDYPQRLRWVLEASADPLFRAAR